MDSLTETLAAARRLYVLGEEASREATYLSQHYQAGHVGESVFDPVSLLISASNRANAEAEALTAYGDDNDLARADVVSEELTRHIAIARGYRMLLDSIHKVRRV